MVDIGLNLFYVCATGCVDLCPQEEEFTSSSCGVGNMYTHISGNNQLNKRN